MAKTDTLVKQARAHFDPGENLVNVVLGVYETKLLGADTVRTGVLVATNRRIVFYAKKFNGFELEVFPYKNISSIAMGKQFRGCFISLYTSGNNVRMKWIHQDADHVQRFVNSVRGRIAGGETTAEIPASPAADEPAAPVKEQGEPQRPGSRNAAKPDSRSKQKPVRKFGKTKNTLWVLLGWLIGLLMFSGGEDQAPADLDQSPAAAQAPDPVAAPSRAPQPQTAAAPPEPEAVPPPSDPAIDSASDALLEEINQLAIIPCILYVLKEEPELTELMPRTEAIDLILNGQEGAWDQARKTILDELAKLGENPTIDQRLGVYAAWINTWKEQYDAQ